MDCSLCKVLRIESPLLQKIHFLDPSGPKEGQIPDIRGLSVFQKRPDFLQAKEWFFGCFLRPCISDTFCRFIPCNLSRLSIRSPYLLQETSLQGALEGLYQGL